MTDLYERRVEEAFNFNAICAHNWVQQHSFRAENSGKNRFVDHPPAITRCEIGTRKPDFYRRRFGRENAMGTIEKLPVWSSCGASRPVVFHANVAR